MTPLNQQGSNRVAGGVEPPAPTTPRMRVRTGRFRRIEKVALAGTSKAGYESRPPGPFHLVRCTTITEVCAAHSLPTVPAFTMSHPLRWALGYCAVC